MFSYPCSPKAKRNENPRLHLEKIKGITIGRNFQRTKKRESETTNPTHPQTFSLTTIKTLELGCVEFIKILSINFVLLDL